MIFDMVARRYSSAVHTKKCYYKNMLLKTNGNRNLSFYGQFDICLCHSECSVDEQLILMRKKCGKIIARIGWCAFALRAIALTVFFLLLSTLCVRVDKKKTIHAIQHLMDRKIMRKYDYLSYTCHRAHPAWHYVLLIRLQTQLLSD